MLEIKNLTKSFEPHGAPVINNLSANFATHKFYGLLGPSGCGKTTLLRAIAGLDRPSSGFIKLGPDIWCDSDHKINLSPEKRHVGMLFQSYAIWPHMSVAQNVGFPLLMQKLPKVKINDEVAAILEKVGLQGFGDRRPNSLSGGQQQRVALARALIQKPKLLLLDEPLSNLDASLRDSMRAEIKRLHQEFSMTSIIVTHDWRDAQKLCDEVIVLNQGLIEQRGTPSEIENSPASDFVKKIIY